MNLHPTFDTIFNSMFPAMAKVQPPIAPNTDDDSSQQNPDFDHLAGTNYHCMGVSSAAAHLDKNGGGL